MHLHEASDETVLQEIGTFGYNTTAETAEYVEEEYELDDDAEYEPEETDDMSSTDSEPYGDGLDRAAMEELADKEMQQWSMDGAAQSLFLPLRLYAMAHRFEVPALKLLARDRFYRAAELTWRDAECFAAVVDEIYSDLPSEDVGMREIVCRLVGSGIGEDNQIQRLALVLAKHGEFALGVINYMVEQKDMVW